jgi:hypothetical protein
VGEESDLVPEYILKIWAEVELHFKAFSFLREHFEARRCVQPWWSLLMALTTHCDVSKGLFTLLAADWACLL